MDRLRHTQEESKPPEFYIRIAAAPDAAGKTHYLGEIVEKLSSSVSDALRIAAQESGFQTEKLRIVQQRLLPDYVRGRLAKTQGIEFMLYGRDLIDVYIQGWRDGIEHVLSTS